MAVEGRYVIFNERNQPVELHVDKQVIVVPARGQVELDWEQVTAQQVQGLLTRGLISVQPAPEVPVQADEVQPIKKKRTVKPKTGRGRRKPK